MKLFLAILFLGNLVFAQTSSKFFTTLPFKGGKYFSYATNFELNQVNTEIEQAIIVVHGSALNFETYFKTMQTLANQQKLDRSTLVIAPHYRTNTESPLAPANELLWTDEGWLRGDPALNLKKLSAFQVIDQFIELLENKNNFPKLKTIILTGHSAGGQLTQRYAVGTEIDFKHPTTRFRFIVANPGSYVYLSDKRLSSNEPGIFSTPKNPGCAYNDYKYGMDNPNAYMKQVPKDRAVKNNLNRDVTYLLGEQDTLIEDFDLTCPALLQGPYRYLRGINFKASLDFEFPGHSHQLISVPGVGHTQWGMYASPLGVESIFSHIN
jgi:pimeloyl-ACP methyl ester carboxylesterase